MELPSDRRIDRRSFLERMTVLTAVASAGVGVPAGLEATTVGAVNRGATRPRPPSVRAWPTRYLPDPFTIQATELWALSLAEAASLIRKGDVSPVELLEAYLGRIHALDGLLMAFNTVPEDEARAAARMLADSEWSGPLHGIPLAIKDNYYTAGVRTTANSHIFADFVPDFDATAWARLQDAGAILVGKTQMGPLATSRATTPDGENTTVNAWAPHDPSVSPGGSSSGSATAVAIGLAASGTGTQTGGSITNPSSAQGLTGFKPTMGRVSLHGIIPLTYTRDHPGPLARDARDAALMLQAMAGPDPDDPRTLGLPPVPDLVRAAEPVERDGRPALRWPTTIGVIPGYLDEPTEPPRFPGREGRVSEQERESRTRIFQARGREAVRLRREMLATFESLGARVVEIDMPEDWETLTSFNFNNVRLPERAEPFLHVLRRDVREFGVSLSPWINGLLLSGTEYVRGQRAKLLLLRRVLDGIFSRCDVVVQTRPIPFDMIGLPLIAFPVGFERSRGYDLPVAGLLGGQPYAEDRLLSVVAAYQSVTDYHRRRPPTPEVPGSGPAPGRMPADRGRMDIWDVMMEGE